MSPRPLEDGDCAHLPWGSLRWSVARTMRMAAAMTAAATGTVPERYAALLAGDNVVLSHAEVASLVPPSRWPAALDRRPYWRLEGNDTLRGQARVTRGRT